MWGICVTGELKSGIEYDCILKGEHDKLQAENKRLKALCLRESKVLKEALKRKNNKSMIAVVAGSLEEQALKNGT